MDGKCILFFVSFFYLIHKIVVSSLGWSRLIEQTIDFLFIFIYSFFFSQLQSQSIGISLHRSSFSCYQSIYKGAQFFFLPPSFNFRLLSRFLLFYFAAAARNSCFY